MADLQRVIVNTKDAPQPIGAYSQAIRVRPGELMYMAGQVSVDRDGNIVGVGDVGAQVRQIFENLGNILASVGASFSNVVEFTTFIVGHESLDPYREARAAVYPDIYPNEDFPPNTLLIISGLAREEFLVEIKAVAALP